MLCLAVAVALLAPRPALASQSVYPQGIVGAPFRLASPVSSNVVVSGGTDQSLSLRVGELWTIGAGSAGYSDLGVSQPDPQSAQVLSPSGDVLVADAAHLWSPSSRRAVRSPGRTRGPTTPLSAHRCTPAGWPTETR